MGGGASGDVTLNINDSVVATISGTTFTGTVNFSAGLSGSLTRLIDGTSYLIAGNNVSITSGSNGSITIESNPGGLDTYVQFNDGGSSFGGDSGMTYNKTTNVLTVGNTTLGGTGQLTSAVASFDLVNTTATTVNFAGGASTALNVGNSSGTNTVNGATTFNQTVNLGDTTSFVTGSLTTSSAVS